MKRLSFVCFCSVQSLRRVRLSATAWTAARQASPSTTSSQSSLKLMSIEAVMPSNHLTRCPPLLLLPSIFPSIRGFSNESVLGIRWPKNWSFNFNISPSNEYSELISIRTDWLDILAVQGLFKSKLGLLCIHLSAKFLPLGFEQVVVLFGKSAWDFSHGLILMLISLSLKCYLFSNPSFACFT